MVQILLLLANFTADCVVKIWFTNTLPFYLVPLATVQQRLTDCLSIIYVSLFIATHFMKQSFFKD